nr:hypothetical protein Iba_chr06aCG12540 [Ipomoea batatas]GMD40243.1 hypothetical protein Iba_chr10aCG7500 [Ipomoea batatas]GMD43498.1 hypothetical protein Iba_chr10cCG5900 [Ipomoea batatas]
MWCRWADRRAFAVSSSRLLFDVDVPDHVVMGDQSDIENGSKNNPTLLKSLPP